MADSNSKIKVYIAEGQEILRDAYVPRLAADPRIEVVGSSGDTLAESVLAAAKALNPDVILLGEKSVKEDTVDSLASLREQYPSAALVLLSASYDTHGIRRLREFSRGNSVGCAFLLKQTIDTVAQIAQVILSVTEGRVILDPQILDGLIAAGDSSSAFLKELSRRELEVLSWMAKGFRNDTIAEVLSLEPKTIERHINSIYSKLGDTPQSKHPRLYAVMPYMRATGMLPPEQANGD